MKSLYAHWSDEVARQATITLYTGTAEDTYGVERLTDDNPAHLFKANETRVAIKFEYATPQAIQFLTLIHATLEATDDVRLFGDDDADWYDPAFDVAITPSGWVGAGVTRWPVNTYVDLREAEGFTEAGFKFYLLTFGFDTPLAQALQLGQIGLYQTVKEFLLDRGMLETRDKPRIDNRTAYGVSTIYSRGTTLWKAQIGLSALLDADDERQAVQDLWSDVDGGNHPWPFVPKDNESPVYLVRWATTDEQIQRVVDGVSNRLGTVEELARGLRPGE